MNRTIFASGRVIGEFCCAICGKPANCATRVDGVLVDVCGKECADAAHRVGAEPECNCPQALALKARVAELEAMLRKAESALSALLEQDDAALLVSEPVLRKP